MRTLLCLNWKIKNKCHRPAVKKKNAGFRWFKVVLLLNSGSGIDLVLSCLKEVPIRWWKKADRKKSAPKQTLNSEGGQMDILKKRTHNLPNSHSNGTLQRSAGLLASAHTLFIWPWLSRTCHAETGDFSSSSKPDLAISAWLKVKVASWLRQENSKKTQPMLCFVVVYGRLKSFAVRK